MKSGRRARPSTVPFAAAALLGLTVSVVGAAPPSSMVRFRVVEVNTSVCEWSGEATFTCREVQTPVTLDLSWRQAPGRTLTVEIDGEAIRELDRPGPEVFGPTEIPVGAHRLGLVTRDGETETWRREFRIDVVLPTTDSELPRPVVRFASPDEGASVADRVELVVRAYNPRSLQRAVDRVELMVDGKMLETLREEPWVATWDTTGWPGGEHILTARAYGSRGLSSETEILVDLMESRHLLDGGRRDLVLHDRRESFELRLPEQATRVWVEGWLQLELEGPGRASGYVRGPEGDQLALFSLASAVERPIPLNRLLDRFRGRDAVLVLMAEGGATLTLKGLDVRSYE